MSQQPPALSRQDGLAEITRRVGSMPPGTRLLGIDGFGAAGKTTFADELATLINNSVVVHLDDFSHPGVPTWDHDRFLAELYEPLQAGRTASYRVWDWRTDQQIGEHTVHPGSVLIIEGVSATDVAIDIAFDLTIWLETPADVRWSRAVDRDPPELLTVWQSEWIPSEIAYAAVQRPRLRADLVVSGDA